MIKKKDIRLISFGIATTFIGLGIGRFAFASLLPEMILRGWFSDIEASYIGTANLVGYLIGAFLAGRFLRLITIDKLLVGTVISIALSYVLCAYPGHYYWFIVCRFIAGVSGALLMVIGPSTVLSLLPKERQALSGNLLFTGLGFGIVFSTAITPISNVFGFSFAWYFLSGITLLSVTFINATIRRYGLTGTRGKPSLKKRGVSLIQDKGLMCLLIAYGLDAIGYVPHTVFWVDYLAREQALGTYTASVQWMYFGIGAILGPMILGVVTHYLGWNKSLIFAFLIKTAAIAIPVFSSSHVGYTLSSFLVGAMLPCIVALVSGSIYVRVGPDYHKHYWALATFVFAILQAASGYVMSLLYEMNGGYHNLFSIAASCLLMGSAFAVLSVLTKEKK